jgi:(4S)-4-hydroxy-5-phosphonooxypentane-2,3-dione isomerase
MIVMIVEVTVKAGMENEFLELITNDALRSEADEPGCLRFDVLQDVENPSKYYFYEVYRDQAAHDAHMQTPHLKRIDARMHDLFDAATVHMTKNVVPTDGGFAR